MAEQKKQKEHFSIVLVSAVILTMVVFLTGCKKQPSEQAGTEHSYESPKSVMADVEADEPLKVDTVLSTKAKMSLNDVVKAARTWGPSFTSWFGKPAPDFTLTDMTGKEHKLSDYHGKDVILVFWASWCRPCLMEIPHLIELRNTISEDKLAMLAISNENPAMLKKFVEQQKINYTVLHDNATLPSPFSDVRSIPSTFFIDPEGRIKLGTIGLLPSSEIKAILQAE